MAKALQTLVHREALNGELRIVDANGIGMSGPYSHVDVSAAFEAAVEALRVGVVVEGPYEDDFRSAFIEGLTGKGYQVSQFDPQTPYDVQVVAKTRVEDAGPGTGPMANKHFARGVIQVEVRNVAAGKVFASFSESRKEGSRSKAEAERFAIRKLTGKIVSEVASKIDSKMRGE